MHCAYYVPRDVGFAIHHISVGLITNCWRHSKHVWRCDHVSLRHNELCDGAALDLLQIDLYYRWVGFNWNFRLVVAIGAIEICTYGDTHDAPRYYVGEGHIASGGRSRCVRLWFMKSVCISAVNRFAHRDIVCCHVCVVSCADLLWCSFHICTCIHRAFGTMMLMMCSIYGNAVAAVRCVSSCKSIARCVRFVSHSKLGQKTLYILVLFAIASVNLCNSHSLAAAALPCIAHLPPVCATFMHYAYIWCTF